MRIGSNEKILLALIDKNPHCSANSLQLQFQIITGKKLKIQRTLKSLREKKLVDKDLTVVTRNINIGLPELPKNIKEIMDIQSKPLLRFGKSSKFILYTLHKTKRSSISFLAQVLETSKENIIPVLQRLENKNLIYRYSSLFTYRNSIGRRYRPKYYGITSQGELVVKTFVAENYEKFKQVDEIICNLERSIKIMTDDFNDTLNIT